MDRLRYVLGLITLAVMVVACWFLVRLLDSSDLKDLYQIEVTFLDGRGLKPGADVKYRGVQIGSVRRVEVDDTGDHAIVLMTFEADKRHLIRENTSFWIVAPRFHGLSSGVSGLETLVRDGYISSLTPTPFGEPLARGSRIPGGETPPQARRDVILPPIQRGDLLMRVLLPENHGVSLGARVMFRGMATGEVRDIALAPSGTHVEVKVRIAALYRSTVTDASVFWVAKPQLSLQFSLSNPLSVDELGSLISPYIAYHTPPKTGVPVHDNYPVAATLDRPSIVITPVPQEALKTEVNANPPLPTGPVGLVRVIYEAIDIDWLSANDKVRREATGILYVDGKGRALVLTARSACDASFFYTETFGEKARIEQEKLAVQLPGGQALKATRIWVQPDGIDQAVLLVEGLPRKYPTTRPGTLAFLDVKQLGGAKLTLHVAGERGDPAKPVPFDLATTKLPISRGGALFQGDKVVGFVGQIVEGDGKPGIVTLVSLPDSLRPAE